MREILPDDKKIMDIVDFIKNLFVTDIFNTWNIEKYRAKISDNICYFQVYIWFVLNHNPRKMKGLSCF